MKTTLRLLLLIFLALVILYFCGSKPDKFDVDPYIGEIQKFSLNMDEYVATKEAHKAFRPNNQSQIVWADTSKSKTAYSLVYLHGFSASHMEGHPVHRAIAQRYGMNLYLSRLHDHGLVADMPLKDMEADLLLESAKEALKIGQEIGENVIVMGVSTGATLAIYLAAHNKELVDGLLFFAPNIDVADPRSFLLTYPWGKELAEFLEGETLSQGMSGPEFDKYWYPTYATESVVELKSLIEHTMTEEVFERIDQPTFVSYYYKNEQEKDMIISTDAIVTFFDKISTPSDKKVIQTSPQSGNHVTVSSITSKDIKTPFLQTCEFLEEVMKLGVKDSSQIDDLLMTPLPSN